ncbi:FeoB-associated Cys-rich membrane protein [Persicitalea jodogahamensis]|uniref:FeoB-associated Cys-rich membrane protein n=1 Tax=Persicitalea jodogahamensis TaxID=402147 RepID=UPI0027E45777|nr:FeoB-associated Cys-rich membrane protein [Persicitalea jodogahamensis]
MMSQQLIVLLIFLAAVGYLGRRAWVSLRRPAQAGCGKGCGCGETDKLVSAKQPVSENNQA